VNWLLFALVIICSLALVGDRAALSQEKKTLER
jgi:hypothetical protein